MFNFSTEQKVLDLNGVKIGGQPGQYPTALFGTLFYGKRYAELTDEVKAIGKEQVEGQIAMAEMTGNPAIVDLFIKNVDDVEPRLDFLLSVLPEGAPFAIDVPEAEVRIKALEFLGSRGALDRVIYNSLNLGITSEEITALKENTPGAAIVLAFNPKDFSTDGRLDMLVTGGGILDKGLLEISEDVGISNLLVDTGATPFDHNATETLRSIPVACNKWGLPVGCAIHNTVESWIWMKKYRRESDVGKQTYKYCDFGANALAIQVGASFCVYGPINNAPHVFPFAAMVDKFIAEGASDYFGVNCSEDHPRRKLQ